MSVHVIIDGYNLIRQSAALSPLDQKDLQLGRDTLVEMLSAYKKIKPHKITVVFDGAEAPQYYQRKDQQMGIRIKYSRNGEEADAVIKRMASRERERALVVSSDRAILEFASSRGAAVIESQAFEQKITMASYLAEKGSSMADEESGGWKPSTKKKGPSRRLSKKKRRNRIKTRKL